MRALAALLLVVGVAIGVGWWIRQRGGVPAPEAPLDLPKGGARIVLVQRHDADVPGSRGRFRVHVGDITKGQVELTLSRGDGTTLVAARSMKQGDAAEFPVGDGRYRVTVAEFRTVLVGDDEVALDFSLGPSERERIEALLKAIETSGLVFVRNGSDHDGPKAAAHLRGKLSAAGDRVRTAEEFIDGIATKSSTSGEPYRVRLADGSVVGLAPWLRGRLEELTSR